MDSSTMYEKSYRVKSVTADPVLVEKFQTKYKDLMKNVHEEDVSLVDGGALKSSDTIVQDLMKKLDEPTAGSVDGIDEPLTASVHGIGVQLDNRYVVPYNPHLLIRYGGHVNVEYCNKFNSIKYLFKYLNKGPDKALMQLSVDGEKRDKSKLVNEIKEYYDCRYVSPCEAVWRIFAFDIHHKWPPVLKLTFHLHNEQSVLYDDYYDIEDVVMYNEEVSTMFLAWFEANRQYVGGRDLTYAEFPTRFTYEKKEKRWQPHKVGYQIGRLHYTPPGIGELYYMRILLTVQKGCMGYMCIKTINGHTYDTCQETCSALGLLDDDKEFIDGITENAELGSGDQLRWLFVHLLTTSTMTSPDVVCDATWQLLSDGILFERRKRLNIPELTKYKCTTTTSTTLLVSTLQDNITALPAEMFLQDRNGFELDPS
ncbi:hypothetical protein MTR_7g026957 [Medicago truncatula]|uniref:Uncharacterized protein n=1 Tax=Medicago truncatula TaxID=3880 RepID=A0A072TWY0_MEDTR|nr:hypothetical protein MTR_7g026957 [Medicago truncatula]